MPHERFMRAAIALARKGVGKTSPNPAVGSVIVKGGKIIASGYHKKAGTAHAEAAALSKTNNAKNSVLYVTLEPCCTFGRTPPCTDAIIASGIKTVVTGAKDPNPRVSGRGVDTLRRSGIEVIESVLASECESLNEAYNRYITTGTPFVTLKLASSLDGRIAASSGESKWITGTEARRLVHRMRSVNDAIMTGSGTVLKDDPELTVRLVKGKSPLRVVLDSALRVPLASRVFRGLGEGDGRLIIFTSKEASRAKIEKARKLGAEVISVPASSGGVSIKSVLRELGKREIISVLVEGGGRLAASLIRESAVDKAVIFFAPMIIGGDGVPSVGPLELKGLGRAPRFERTAIKRAGADLMFEGYPVKGKKKPA